jgi:hypothetical protein
MKKCKENGVDIPATYKIKVSGDGARMTSRGGKNIPLSGTATKSGKIFCELSTQTLYNLMFIIKGSIAKD